MSSQGFSVFEKNAVICSQWAMLNIQSGVTASADSNGSLVHFYFELELAGLGVAARC
jgi:hypothetical protein